MHKGLSQIYTGNGKGKTTCSVGLAMRAKSRECQVLYTQFMKTIKGGETELMKRVGIEVQRFEHVLSPLFHPKANPARLRERALEAMDEIAYRLEGIDMLVMDEFIHLIDQQMVTEAEVRKFMENRPVPLDVVLTGRGAPDWLIALADHVTEMKEIKHHANQGHVARKGIEY
jgi:cob(I)alamin adenosyltransferase